MIGHYDRGSLLLIYPRNDPFETGFREIETDCRGAFPPPAGIHSSRAAGCLWNHVHNDRLPAIFHRSP